MTVSRAACARHRLFGRIPRPRFKDRQARAEHELRRVGVSPFLQVRHLADRVGRAPVAQERQGFVTASSIRAPSPAASPADSASLSPAMGPGKTAERTQSAWCAASLSAGCTAEAKFGTVEAVLQVCDLGAEPWEEGGRVAA